MACEAEFAAMTNAILALDTSIIAMEAAQAVVNSNMQAANAAIMNYQICMNGMGAQPPDPMMNTSKAKKKKSHAEKIIKGMTQAMTAIGRWTDILKRDAGQLPRKK